MDSSRVRFGRKVSAVKDTALSKMSVPTPAVEPEHSLTGKHGTDVSAVERTEGHGTSPSTELVAPLGGTLEMGNTETKGPYPVLESAELYGAVRNFVREHMLDLENIKHVSKTVIRKEIEDELPRVLRGGLFGPPLTTEEAEALIIRVLDDVFELGPLTPLLKDPTITDIFVNGPDEIWIEKSGKMSKSEATFDDTQQLMQVIYRIASQNNRHVDSANPILDTRLVDGSRVNIVLPPATTQAPSISIRRFASGGFTLDELVKARSMSSEMGLFLSIIIKLKRNILISGGTGSGKTTLLGALTRSCHNDERIVSIEDTAELKIFQPNLVGLECRQANIEGRGEITIRDLLRNALRMRPDRIIIGEVRGAEASDLLDAMNTGHRGCIGTIHANSPGDAILRFESMICMDPRYIPGIMTKQRIASVIDVVVQMTRAEDGTRQISRISEVVNLEGENVLLQDLFRLNPTRNGGQGSSGEQRFKRMNAQPGCLQLEGSALDFTAREAEYIRDVSGQSVSGTELLTNARTPILIVDDDTIMLKVYEASLTNIYQVHTAESGEQALTILGKEGPFPLIISDMEMPGMDGVTFLSKCRRQFPDSVRIMLTGKGNIDTLEGAINEAGVYRYLKKPMKSKELIRVLEELNGHHTAIGVQ